MYTSPKDTQRPEPAKNFKPVLVNFGISCLAWPVVYICQCIVTVPDEMDRPVLMLLLFSSFFLLVPGLIKKFGPANKDFLYYGVALLTFTSMTDVITFLEIQGIISNFLAGYLHWGERYLDSPWGAAYCIFDGTGFLAMQLLLTFAFSNGRCCRSLKLYWSVGCLSMIVTLVLGALVGKHDINFSTAVNTPFVLFPVVVLTRYINADDQCRWKNSIRSNSLIKIGDLFLTFGFITSMGICLGKGLTVLAYAATSGITNELLKLEPILLSKNPGPFIGIQALIYLFYLVPMHFLYLRHCLVNGKPRYLWDVSLVHAGIILPLQFCHIFCALHPRTPDEFKSDYSNLGFWLVNIIPVVIPHIFIYRLRLHRNTKELVKQC